MKVSVLYHANKASRRRIKQFQKRMKKTITKAEAEGYTIGIQNESIVTAYTRARKKVYTYGDYRAVYTYTGSYAKTIVFGFLTIYGKGYFEWRDKFTRV